MCMQRMKGVGVVPHYFIDASGLVERRGCEWRFTVDCPDKELLAALLLPLGASCVDHHPLFQPDDPWQHRSSLEDLCEWLSARTEMMENKPTGPPSYTYESRRHSALRAIFDSSRGRGLSLQGECDPGELLLREEPYSAVLHREHFDTNCHSCFLPIEGALLEESQRCARGCEMYCSSACRIRSFHAGHQTECGTRYFGCGMPTTVLLCTRALMRLAYGSGGGDPRAIDHHCRARRVQCESLGDGVPITQWMSDHARSFDATLASQLRLHAHVAHRVLFAGSHSQSTEQAAAQQPPTPHSLNPTLSHYLPLKRRSHAELAHYLLVCFDRSCRSSDCSCTRR